MHRQTLWIVMSAVTAFLGTTATYADFIDDSQVQLKFRNFYLDRQLDQPDPTKPQDFGSWSQAVTLDAKSGYTDIGPVKVGVDVLAQYALRLSGDRGDNDYVMPFDYNSKEQARDNFKVGATLKAKISQTELKVGEILPVSPVVHFDPSRQLLTTFEGAWLESKDLKNTKVTLGYLDGINARYENQVHDFGLWPNELNTDKGKVKDGTSDEMLIAGIDYQITPELSASYFYADVDNIYKQNYVGFAFNKKLDEHNKIATHIRYFDNQDSGDAIYGEIENQALSLKGAWTHDNHMIDVGYQQIFGDTGNVNAMFPTLSGWVPQPYLVNWSVASFIRKDERSWSLGYTYDFKDTVAKGLTVTARHYDGSNIQNKNGTRGKEQEDNLIVNYVVPEGTLKGLGFQWMYINVNYANVPGFVDLQENRVATTYSYRF